MFIVYDALAEPSLKRMNNIVGSAVNMCAVAYLLVGSFQLKYMYCKFQNVHENLIFANLCEFIVLGIQSCLVYKL